MKVDELRHKLSELAREHIDPYQVAIVIVCDAASSSYSIENANPKFLPAALRELADKIDFEAGAKPLHMVTARGPRKRE